MVDDRMWHSDHYRMSQHTDLLAGPIWDKLTDLPGIGMDFLSFLFMLFGQYSLVIGALLISLFVGWVWGVKAAGEEVRENDGEFPLGRTWGFLIRFVAPSAIVAILVKMVVDLV